MVVQCLGVWESNERFFCEVCQKGKLVKTPFEVKNIIFTSNSLELLHIDQFGAVDIAYIKEKKYGLVIVGDFSRWTWVKFLRSKDASYDVFSVFKKLSMIFLSWDSQQNGVVERKNRSLQEMRWTNDWCVKDCKMFLGMRQPND